MQLPHNQILSEFKATKTWNHKYQKPNHDTKFMSSQYILYYSEISYGFCLTHLSSNTLFQLSHPQLLWILFNVLLTNVILCNTSNAWGTTKNYEKIGYVIEQ